MFRRYAIWVVLIALITSVLLHSHIWRQKSINSLTYFPNDPTLDFFKAQTHLSMERVQSSTNYKLNWTTISQTNIPVYLRQDVALLFQNGKLIQVSNKWKRKVTSLNLQQALLFQGISHFEAISVHYAESHLANGTIGSKEVMSFDHLFVRANGYENIDAFKIPIDKAETDFQREITRSVQQEQHYIAEEAAKKYHLQLDNYDVIPLSHLEVYRQNTLPHLDEKNSQRVISQLWEGLYQDYILGIRIDGQKMESPLGSSMPLILFPKKGKQILVVIQSKSNQLILLKQSLF